MIKQVNLNILAAKTDVIAHCANCQNVMGSGVAKAICEQYPEVREAEQKTEKGDRTKLGSVHLVHLSGNIDKSVKPYLCCNLYGQYDYGTEKRQVNYEAIYQSLENLKIHMKQRSLNSVAFPYKMASDRAGGDWRIIISMIEVVFENSNIDVLICKYEE